MADGDDKLTQLTATVAALVEEVRALRAELRPPPRLRYTPNPAPHDYTPLPSIDVTPRRRQNG
jgi:hypothetical protein